MLPNILYIVCGLVLLPLGAQGLVRGSTGLALRVGVTALAIGLTVIAFGTGSPEFVLSIEAARAGNGGIALGNIVGSNIANLTLVIGLAALVKPMTVRSALVRREMPLMIGVTLLLCALLLDGRLSRPEGLLLVVGAVGYTVSSYLAAKRGETKEVVAEFDDALTGSKRSVRFDFGLLSAGLVALLVGAHLLLRGATAIAADLGISQVVIGLTIVAVGTSLPELATSVTSTLRGEADVAFGNVIGSNVLNITAVLGVAALIRPFEVQGLRSVDLLVMVASAVLLLPLMWRGSVLNRWEGAMLLTGYVAYMYSLVK
ncbi:MAG: calcium/sodium antiporter [Actinobacteria bacterium]|nr:calcium/sodium antiporter [Actinomycetota bacterium]